MAVSKNTVLSALRDFKELQDAANAQKFVAKENGKQLSTNDFTDAYKNKLLSLKNYTLPAATTESLGGIIVGDGLEVTGNGTLNVTLTGGGESNIIEAISIDGDIQPIVDKTAILSLSDYAKKAEIGNGGSNIIEAISIDGDIQPIVNKVATLSLSNYAKKTDISNGELNIIEAISIDGKSQTISNKTAQLDLSNYAKKTDVGAGVRVKGSVNSFSQLPTTAVTGDLYNIKTAGGTDDYGVEIKAGDNVVRTDDNKWDVFAGLIDFSNYVTKDGNKVLSTNDFTNADKDKLNGLQNYTLSAATKVSLGGIIPGEGLGMAGDKLDILYGEGLSIANNTLTVTMVSGGNYDVFTGATNTKGGTSGLVPPPTTGQQNCYLRGNGKWETVSAGTLTVNPIPPGDSIVITSGIPDVEGALWYEFVNDMPMLRLRSGERVYNFKADTNENVPKDASPLVPDVDIIYQLTKTTSTVMGGIWYQNTGTDDAPVIYVRGNNFQYLFYHDTQTYVGPASDKLVAYLPFNTDEIYDACGNVWTTEGSPAIVTNPVTGGKALNCNGKLSHKFNITVPWTIDCWLTVATNYTVDSTSWKGLFGNSEQYGVNVNGSGLLYLYQTSNGSAQLSSLKGQRVHLALVSSTTSRKLYVNGECVAEDDRKTNLSISPIFRSYNSYSGFYIDHFRIRSKAVWTGNFTVPDATEYI